MAARRSFWGWGAEGAGPTDAQAEAMAETFAARMGVAPQKLRPAPRLEDTLLPKPRVAPPAALEACCASDAFARASHTYGKSYRDIVRGAAGDFSPATSGRIFSSSLRSASDNSASASISDFFKNAWKK